MLSSVLIIYPPLCGIKRSMPLIDIMHAINEPRKYLIIQFFLPIHSFREHEIFDRILSFTS